MNTQAEYRKLECWFKVRVKEDYKAMDFLRTRWFERGLVFGESYPASRCDKSVIVRASDAGPAIDGAVRIVCPILSEARFVSLVGGYQMRSATVADVFSQYPGPYDLITALDSGRDRAVFWSDCVLSALPKLYAISEDGHNEEVIKRADEMGYNVIVCEDAVLMGRQLW